MRKLVLEHLHLGQAGITPQTGAFLAEAAATSLYLSGHQSLVQLRLKSKSIEIFVVEWNQPINAQILKGWNDVEEATEFGAMGIAVLLINEVVGLEVAGRARKGDFSDYYLGDVNTRQVVAELEVSGIFTENKNNRMNMRVRAKEKQVSKNTKRSYPVYIVVVEFSKPKAKMVIK